MRFLAAAALAAIVGCSDPPPAPQGWAAAFDANDAGWLMNVWGPRGDALFAVGGRPSEGRVYRYDGRAWSRATLGVDVPLLNWVWGFGADDVTAVGNHGTVLHWDGRAWTRQSTPRTENLWGVWGASSTDLWAVGGNGAADDRPVLLHWDGAAWSDVAVPSLQRASVGAFYKVWGLDADNVYVVGQRGVVLHRTGGAWREELAGASGDLVSVWGTDATHVLAVGGRANGIVSRWDGARWTARSYDTLPGLNGVWMRSPRAAHVVGANGTAARIDLDTLAVTEETTPTTYDLHAVYGDPAGALTAVGGTLGSNSGPFFGVALRRPLRATE